jgi:hypothetical protein
VWQNKKIHICSKQHHVVVYAISEIEHSFQNMNEKQIKTMRYELTSVVVFSKEVHVFFPCWDNCFELSHV